MRQAEESDGTGCLELGGDIPDPVGYLRIKATDPSAQETVNIFDDEEDLSISSLFWLRLAMRAFLKSNNG